MFRMHVIWLGSRKAQTPTSRFLRPHVAHRLRRHTASLHVWRKCAFAATPTGTTALTKTAPSEHFCGLSCATKRSSHLAWPTHGSRQGGQKGCVCDLRGQRRCVAIQNHLQHTHLMLRVTAKHLCASEKPMSSIFSMHLLMKVYGAHVQRRMLICLFKVERPAKQQA
jgi:hypothetical protein